MQSIELDWKTSALILIDLQNSVVARKVAPHSAVEVVRRCAELALAFRKHGAAVVYVRVDIANFLKLRVDVPSRDPNAPPPPANASDLVPEAGMNPGDLIVTKRHWSAFLGTDLEHQLIERGIHTVVLGGIATNFGVESTARDAAGLGFDVILVEDAMASLSPEAHRFSVETIFPRLGRVRRASQLRIAAG
ncbi:MAG: isochorismatase family protein [Thiobacillaceae bacterium]